MRKIYTVAGVFACFLFFLSGIVCAEEAPKNSEKKMTQSEQQAPKSEPVKQNPKSIVGTVVGISSEKISISYKHDIKDFLINKDTVISASIQGGKTQEGKKVRTAATKVKVTYIEDYGNNIATKISPAN